MIKKITIEIIPHLDQRYNTVGDWQFTRDEDGLPTELNIKVSNTQSDDMNCLIAIHEMIESLLCELGGVKEEKVDEFDMTWEPIPAYWDSEVMLSEPGEDMSSPYYKQHQTAMAVERLCATAIWMNWARHEAIIDKLSEDSKPHFARKLAESYTVTEETNEDLTIAPLVKPLSTDPLDHDDDIPF